MGHDSPFERYHTITFHFLEGDKHICERGTAPTSWAVGQLGRNVWQHSYDNTVMTLVTRAYVVDVLVWWQLSLANSYVFSWRVTLVATYIYTRSPSTPPYLHIYILVTSIRLEYKIAAGTVTCLNERGNCHSCGDQYTYIRARRRSHLNIYV